MGKVFVKSPVESPDDLLAKRLEPYKQYSESAPGYAGRLALDAFEGGTKIMDPKQYRSGGDLFKPVINLGRYIASGKLKRKLSPQQQMLEALRMKTQMAGIHQQELAEQAAEDERAENIRMLENLPADDERRFEPLPEITGSRFTQAGKASRQAFKDAEARRAEMYEQLQQKQNLPLQQRAEDQRLKEVEDRAAALVEYQDKVREMRGQDALASDAYYNRAKGVEAVNEATTADQGPPGPPPTPFRVKDVLEPDNPEKQLLDVLTGADEQAPLPNTPMPGGPGTVTQGPPAGSAPPMLPSTGPQPNMGDIAADVARNGTSSSPYSATVENNEDNAFGAKPENNDDENPAGAGVEEPKEEPESPPPAGDVKVAPAANLLTGPAFDPTKSPFGEEEEYEL